MYEEIRQKIEAAQNIFVFTGAGVSAASGLATYRGEDGVHESKFKGLKATEITHVRMLKSDPKLFWDFKRRTLIQGLYVQPNPAHTALVLLEKYCKRENKSFTLVTQNVERLHQRAGSENVVEVHGHVTELNCMNLLSCRHTVNAKDHLDANPEPIAPLCPRCGTVMRPPVILFGEKYPSKMIDLLKMKIKNYADLFISAGTSFQLFSPITAFPRIFKAYSEEGKLLDFNINETHVSRSFADIFVEGPCDETLWKSVGFTLDDFPWVPHIYELRRAVFENGNLLENINRVRDESNANTEGMVQLLLDAFKLTPEASPRLATIIEEPNAENMAELERFIASQWENWRLLI